jgi:hypothetical protein
MNKNGSKWKKRRLVIRKYQQEYLLVLQTPTEIAPTQTKPPKESKTPTN